MSKYISNEELYRLIIEFQHNNHLEFGVNIKKLCEKIGWPLLEYNNNHKLISISKDGFTYYKNNEFYIFFNNDKIEERINFTIAHEVGHIVLGHHFVENTQVLMYGQNTFLEKQANTFAQNILMPADKMYIFENHPIPDVARYFGVSKSMANVRINRLNEDLYYLNKLK